MRARSLMDRSATWPSSSSGAFAFFVALLAILPSS
jgi:hypothetical protein